MNWFTGVVLYVLIWWTVLFAVLPIGTHPVETPDELTGWRGAPEQPRILMKVAITTLVAAVVWFGAWLLITSQLCKFSPRLVRRAKRLRLAEFKSGKSPEFAICYGRLIALQAIITVRGRRSRPPTCRVTAFPPQTWPCAPGARAGFLLTA